MRQILKMVWMNIIGILIKFQSLLLPDKLAVWGILVTLLFGLEGIRLSKTQITIGEDQIKLSHEQGKTSIAISHFDTLLRKMDTSITAQIAIADSLVVVNKNLSYQISILDSQLKISQKQQSY